MVPLGTQIQGCFHFWTKNPHCRWGEKKSVDALTNVLKAEYDWFDSWESLGVPAKKSQAYLASLIHGSSTSAHPEDWMQGQEMRQSSWSMSQGRSQRRVGGEGSRCAERVPLNCSGPTEVWGPSGSWENPFRQWHMAELSARTGRGQLRESLPLHPGSAERCGQGKTTENTP